MMLVLFLPPVLLEPIDKFLERSMVLLVEVEAARTHFDEFLDNSLFGYVSEDDVLRVSR